MSSSIKALHILDSDLSANENSKITSKKTPTKPTNKQKTQTHSSPEKKLPACHKQQRNFYSIT